MVYVTDYQNNRVQIFSEDGTWRDTILPNRLGSPGGFERPTGVCEPRRVYLHLQSLLVYHCCLQLRGQVCTINRDHLRLFI